MLKNIVDAIKVENLINDHNRYNAHIKKSEDNKTVLEVERLLEHIKLCEEYFLHICTEKNLVVTFKKFQDVLLPDLSENGRVLFKKLLLSVVSFHDIGKINPLFQRIKMENQLFEGVLSHRSSSEHSIYSSIIYVDYYFDEIFNSYGNKLLTNNDVKGLLPFLVFNSYIISRHHSGFNNLKDYIKALKTLLIEEIGKTKEILSDGYFRELKINKSKLDNILGSYNSFVANIEEDIQKNNTIYIYERLMLSLLIASDYFGTSQFMSDIEINDLGNIDDIKIFQDTFHNSRITKFIREYEESSYGKIQDFSKVNDINVLRNELFLDAEKALLQNLDSNIFYLEAPTGSGKSNVANNLAYKLIEHDSTLNKIFYVYPFNTLIEQNINNISKMYDDNKAVLDKVAVINSLHPIKTPLDSIDRDDNVLNNNEFKEYEKAFLNREFLNYPMILTTHVSLFKYLFGCSKETIFPVYQLVNSVIVLDEIQSYKNKIWIEIIEFLNSYAEVLNIKIIIMSATLPNLQLLLNTESKSVNLIEDRNKYFKHQLFKDRVKCDYSLLESTEVFDEIINKIKGYTGKKILVEFITKSNAYKFYDILNELEESGDIAFEIRLITGDDNTVEREKIISEIKSKNNIILVATQVIEAGVDIDMNIGFKDISIYDSEEQFLGRINRSCLNKDVSIVYFFNLDEANVIYKEDIRRQKDLTLVNPEIQELLSNKDCGVYYQKVLDRNIANSKTNTSFNTEEFFKGEVNKLNFISVEERMKLIEDDRNDINIFLNYALLVDGKEISGEKVWNDYKKILKDNRMGYSEKQVKLSFVKAQMNNFIFRIRTKYTFSYNDRIGELLYIDNGNDYFKNGKLDKEKFESNVGEFI